jgi:hypothetical protein
MKGVVTKRALVRVLFWPGAVLTVAVGLFLIAAFGTEHQVADAQMVNFYAGECTGGWDNVALASGEPEVTAVSSLPYTKENSAYLENKISPISCGQFNGSLPPETYHTRVMVRFSWKQDTPAKLEVPVIPDAVPSSGSVSSTTEATSTGGSDGSVASSTAAEASSTATSTLASNQSDEATTTTSEATSTGEEIASSSDPVSPEATSATDTPATVPSPAIDVIPPGAVPAETVESQPEPEPSPAPAADIVSWWPLVLPAFAHAEELATSTPDYVVATDTQLESSSTSSHEESTTTMSLVTDLASSSLPTTAIPDGAQFVVQYTLDGNLWHVLGYVTSIDADVRLEFPKDILPSLTDISQMQVSVTPLMHFDTIQPVYLDALWLEVSYAPLGELGVHGISDIVPTITPFDSLISDTEAGGEELATSSLPHMTTADFANRIKRVHGIDDRYTLVSVLVGTSTTEVWLFDMIGHVVHRIGSNKAQIGTMQPATKDGMIFWLNAGRDTLYSYDLRTSGSLHEMTLVGNLPVGSEYILTFPFTSWQVIWRGDTFYFKTRKTGEVFQDENTESASTFFAYFGLATLLPFDRIQDIGGTFITEVIDTIVSTSSSSGTTETSTSTSTVDIAPAGTSTIEIGSTSTIEQIP